MKRTIHDLFDRELSNKFRSKADFYSVLTDNLQYYLPPQSNVNKDFLRDVFAEKKKLMKFVDICQVHVPKYAELKVSDVWALVKDDKEFTCYFPSKMAKGRQIDRQYFFNIFNTLYPERLEAIIKHAHTQRNIAIDEEMKKETIQISEDWVEQLKSIPFKSKERGRTVFLLKQKAKRQAAKKARKQIPLLKDPLENQPMKDEQPRAPKPSGSKPKDKNPNEEFKI